MYLPHWVGVLPCLDAGGVDRTVGLMSHVEHHHGSVVAADRQQRVVYWMEVKAHHLVKHLFSPATQVHGTVCAWAARRSGEEGGGARTRTRMLCAFHAVLL